MAELNYIGTRDKHIKVKASKAILKGICSDGGLYIPEKIPMLDKTLKELSVLSYQDLAMEVLKLYLTDFSQEELRFCINSAYDEKFDDKIIAPLVKKDDVLFLELFHGKTLAFKDMALSILPYLMKISAKKNNMEKEIVILTATSGDTGKAALEGFANVTGTRIIVFFPENGVSVIQKLQMVTQEGENTSVVAIKGNFDDAQSAVKSIFTDKKLARELDDNGFVFSSANSINIGRLVPQIVYYFHAYFQAVAQGAIELNEEINFTVPTGNFGNILAGYYAKAMGLPIKNFVCASNDNKVLYDFFTTGTYNKNREFVLTVSPSMDILISSNLERLLCHEFGSEKTKELMQCLNSQGEYNATFIGEDIIGEFVTEEETFEAIKDLFEKTGYVMDTHTAVAYSAYKKYKFQTGDNTKMVIVSTASPYKFTKDVCIALDDKNKDKDVFLLMKELENISGVKIPDAIADIENKAILHKNVCEKENIKEFVRGQLIK